MFAAAIDAYGNNLADVTTSTSFSDFCILSNPFQCAVDEPYGTTSASVQGTYGTATGQTSVTVEPESWSCRGSNYDVNESDTDGCETPGSLAGTTQGTATSLGDLSCEDTDTFTTDTLGAAYEVMPSDQQVHEMPSVLGFDSETGSAPVWFSINATGGMFCEDNVNITLQMSNTANPTCYELAVTTDKGTFSAQTNASGTAAIVEPSGSYTDGSTVTLELQKTCSTAIVEAPTFTISGNL